MKINLLHSGLFLLSLWLILCCYNIHSGIPISRLSILPGISVVRSLFMRPSRKNHPDGVNKNPFLQIGDIIYLYSVKGRHRVVSISDEGFVVTRKPFKTKAKQRLCKWDDLKRWSSDK